MKITKKSLLSLVMALAIILSVCVVSVPAEAASKKTKKVTLFVGEQLTVYPIGGSLKKVKSTKKKVCAVKKKSGNALLTAKKAGKATVNIKTTGGSFKYIVTVKKNPFKIYYQPMENGLLVSVKNTSSTFFRGVDVVATLCDKNGNPLNQKSAYVSYLGKGQTGYDSIYSYDTSVDLSKTKFKISRWSRDLDYKSTNYSSKVNVKNIQGTSSSGNKEIKFSANCNYSGKGTIYVAQDIICYGANGRILKLITNTTLLYSTKNVYTSSYGDTIPSDCVSYKVVSTRVYLSTYISKY